MAKSNVTTVNDLVFPFTNYVLALPGWYPTWLDPLPGDFNQRHIQAASTHLPQIVLYIGKDQTGTIKKVETRYNQLTKLVIEVVVIYPKKKVELLDKLQSNVYFLRLLNKHASFIKKRWGKPALLHSYIVIKGGVSGAILAKRWQLPMLLTENWTIYYPEDPGHLSKRNGPFRWIVKRVFEKASWFLPVTENLYKQATKTLKSVPHTVVPNVVDVETFNFTDEKKASEFRFVHVSTMIYQKNPHGLLRCFKALLKTRPGASLVMVGPYPEEVKTYCINLGLTEKEVRFTGALPYKKVADILHTCDALVLFSRYENLPCVILESLCCGLPIISTRVGGIAEVINETNGILVERDNEGQLIKALNSMVSDFDRYDRSQIATDAIARFSYEAVGLQIGEIYKKFHTPT